MRRCAELSVGIYSPVISLQRYLAVHYQYLDYHHYIPYSFLDPEHAEPLSGHEQKAWPVG
ncbi:hypothetical protein ALQ72_100117 [Pseudomonas syringae pv. maculicola]|uniref:Uncharacterized protein n=1 Tax=Pseudomonas syringae pv. maculicola TaxID=59511 RepID=A0A3M6C3Y7_PSEYM|nr:hypothetical protein ALQ72_100117 [Pseudomonas syringae pv. maculicola]RMV38116.1 hypothetical protein ALP13_101307 [Pseudomonas syringae pv. maculicola]